MPENSALPSWVDLGVFLGVQSSSWLPDSFGAGFVLDESSAFGSSGCTLAANRLNSLLRDLHKCLETLARREGLEPPTLRFEA